MTKVIEAIVSDIPSTFNTFGGGGPAYGNPVAAAMQDGSLKFALGVSVEDVVIFVVDKLIKGGLVDEEVDDHE